MFGLGCVAGAAGIARVHDYLRGAPDEVAVLLSVELCSLTLQRDDDSTREPRRERAVRRRRGGGGRGRLGARGGPRVAGPTVLDSRSHLYPDTERTMGWDITSTGLKIVLDADVPTLVRRYLGDDVRGFLGAHELGIDDVTAWVCHPGGPKVIEAIQDVLDAGPDALELTWRSLAEIGNLSSSSVLHVLRDTLQKHPPARHARSADGDGPGVLLGTRPAAVELTWAGTSRWWRWSRSSGLPSWSCRSATSGGAGARRGRDRRGALPVHGRAAHRPARGVRAGGAGRRPFVPWLGWTMLAVVVASQALRWWCIATLGRQWNTRIFVVPGAGRVTGGPYRLLSPSELRGGGARGCGAAAGAHRVDHRGRVHGAERGAAAGADHGREPRRWSSTVIDLLVAGGGPAGLVTALHAARAGLSVRGARAAAGADRQGVRRGADAGRGAPRCAALGVSPCGMPFRGIRYLDGSRSAVAAFRAGDGPRRAAHRVARGAGLGRAGGRACGWRRAGCGR